MATEEYTIPCRSCGQCPEETSDIDTEQEIIQELDSRQPDNIICKNDIQEHILETADDRSVAHLAYQLAVIGDEVNQMYERRFQSHSLRQVERLIACICQRDARFFFRRVRKYFENVITKNHLFHWAVGQKEWIANLLFENVCIQWTLAVLAFIIVGVTVHHNT